MHRRASAMRRRRGGLGLICCGSYCLCSCSVVSLLWHVVALVAGAAVVLAVDCVVGGAVVLLVAVDVVAAV
eukprot:5959952-Pyramimonas_sp.AAC.1